MTPTPRAWLMAYGDDPSTDWCSVGPKEPQPDDDGKTIALFDQAAIDTLQSEINRLRDDRNCEKRIRKDAEAVREDLIVKVARLNAEVASLLRGVRVKIPTDAMEQEFAHHWRSGAEAERERCASLAESWPNYRISVTSIGPQIARQIRGAKP